MIHGFYLLIFNNLIFIIKFHLFITTLIYFIFILFTEKDLHYHLSDHNDINISYCSFCVSVMN